MTTTVVREDFLRQLESAQAGLSSREILEQSSCFVFKDGAVLTYNGEIACRQRVDIPFTGAVQAAPLLSILRLLPDKELELFEEDDALRIHGERRRCSLQREKQITLPVTKVERPGEWVKLPESFLEAVTLVQHCASKDHSKFAMSCIHIHPQWLEACDNSKATRARVKTGVPAPTLVRRDSLKQVPTLAMTKMSLTDGWLHFRNPDGLTLSCRRYDAKDDSKYPDLDVLYEFEGHQITLPKGLADVAKRAAVFSAENSDDSQVRVELGNGKLSVRGAGAVGWFKEYKDAKNYKGPPLAFMVAPEQLVEIVEHHTEAEITEGKLRVSGGTWTFVTCLGPVE